VYPDPEPELIEAVADVYLSSNYDVRAVVRHILLSEAFWSERARFALIKSPVEFVVGTLRALGMTAVPLRLVLGPLALMGQVLFNPPTVAGWDWGLGWINTATLLTRYNVAAALTRARGRRVSFDVVKFLQDLGLDGRATADELVERVLWALGPLPVPSNVRRLLVDYLQGDGGFRLDARTADKQVRGLVHLALTLPEYQRN